MTLIGYVKVARPPLAVLGLIAPLALTLWSGKPLPYEGLLIILSIFLGNLGYTMMNEAMDEDVDRISKPYKPVPSGQVDVEKVLTAAILLIVISAFSIALLALLYGVFYLVGYAGLFFSHIYNVVRKDLVGNICLSGAYGMAALISVYPRYLQFPVAFAMLTFAFNLAVQYQDLKSEEIADVVTAPRQLGQMGTSLLGIALSGGAGALFHGLLFETGYLSLIPFIISSLSCLCSSFSVSFLSPSSRTQEVLNRYLGRIFMLMGFTLLICEVIR
jgi:geranylgeranylglycerol-phosphate geranylgeranyltransferase